MGSRLEKNSAAVRKRIEGHEFGNEEGDEYEPSKFGGFSEYFRRKKIKLQNLDAQLRSETTENPHIFRGVVAHVNGYTQPSLNDLHKLIVSHGGGFMQYLDGKTTVTHIICSNLTPKKAVEFKRYRIVKPAWVVQSVKAGRLLPWDEFRVLAEGAGQRVLGFENGAVVSRADKKRRGYHEEIEGSWYTEQLQKAAADSPQFLLRQVAGPTIAGPADEIDDVPSSTSPELDLSRADPTRSQAYPASPDSSPMEREISPEDKLDHATKDSLELALGASGPDERLTELADKKFGSTEALELQEAADKSGYRDQQPDVREPIHGWTLEAIEDYAKGARQSEVKAPQEDSRGVKRSTSEATDSVAKRSRLTAEEHNALLLADPHIRKSTVVNPDFLEQYYRESRLHHLSTWKSELKAQMQAMAAEKTASQKQRKKRPAGSRRYIMHVDFDSFFAAVSLRKHPEYADKPAVVAHGQGSGSEIASCNYPARAFGVKNGMWMKRALSLCPDLKILPYDFPAYEEASWAFYDAIIASGGVVQSVSIDEALVDISDSCLGASGSDGKDRAEGSVDREQLEADKVAQELRDEVKEKTGCNVSIGIGGNILLAKVALRKAKPAGQYQIKPEEVLDFIGKLEVQDLPGVAYSLGGKLEDLGIKYVRDIRETSRERLITSLGPKTGEKMWEYARGIDRTEVGDVTVRKSVSAEVNWGVRFENQEQVDEFIESLCGELTKRLLKERVKGRQLTMKVMRRSLDAPLDPPKHLGHGKCDTHNKSVQLGVSTNAKETIFKAALLMLNSFAFSPGELRGLGVQMTKLEPMKTSNDGQLLSSQPKLLFKQASVPKAQTKEPEPVDPILDDIVTPKKQQKHPDDADIGFGADQLAVSTPSRKPLNTTGTQFVMPTQVDPQVLAELPEDIRAKLAGHVDFSKFKSTSKSGTSGTAAVGLPNQSQLDPDILNALPDDVKDEIMAFYRSPIASSPSFRKRQDQSVLPQSPRTVRTIDVPRKALPAPAPLRRRGRPPKHAIQAVTRGNATLTQSNFVAERFARAASHDGGTTTGTDTEIEEATTSKRADDDDGSEASAEFLAALPEDIRSEVLAEQRLARLKKKSGFDLALARKKRPVLAKQAVADDDELPSSIQRLLRLPPRRAKPTFTSRRLSNLSDLRGAMSAWHTEFRREGPYEEDVGALVRYLGLVVGDEKDMAKAVAVVKWLAWLIEEGAEDVIVGQADSAAGTEKWGDALTRVKDAVRQAVEKRGLGTLEL